jgi:surface-anchored protein
VLLNSADGLPDALNLARGVHAHGNWAFRASGTYTLTFEVAATTTGGAPKSSGPVAYQVVVGSQPATARSRESPPISETGSRPVPSERSSTWPAGPP